MSPHFIIWSKQKKLGPLKFGKTKQVKVDGPLKEKNVEKKLGEGEKKGLIGEVFESKYHDKQSAEAEYSMRQQVLKDVLESYGKGK